MPTPRTHIIHRHTTFVGRRQQKGINTRQRLKGMRFDPMPPPDGQPAKIVSATYSDSFAAWSYSEPVRAIFSLRRWRTSSRRPQLDSHQRRQRCHRLRPSPTDGHFRRRHRLRPRHKNGRQLFTEVQLWGSGPALIVRDGLLYQATWNRKDRFGVLNFYGFIGQSFPAQTRQHLGSNWLISPRPSPNKTPRGALCRTNQRRCRNLPCFHIYFLMRRAYRFAIVSHAK